MRLAGRSFRDLSEQRPRGITQLGKGRNTAAGHSWSMGSAGQQWGMEPGCHVTGFGFYPESSEELLEGFKHGDKRVKFVFGKDHSGSSANSTGRNEARGRETHLEATFVVPVRAGEFLC